MVAKSIRKKQTMHIFVSLPLIHVVVGKSLPDQDNEEKQRKYLRKIPTK